VASEGRGISAAAENDAMRYRRAAEAALEQLDRCIRVPGRMRNSEISTRLAKNRNQIKHNLM
jgi:hypothetical protein